MQFDKAGIIEHRVYLSAVCWVCCCRLKLGALINLDLCPVLNGQPLQMLCKNVQVRRVGFLCVNTQQSCECD